jgi:hypothetical protein
MRQGPTANLTQPPGFGEVNFNRPAVTLGISLVAFSDDQAVGGPPVTGRPLWVSVGRVQISPLQLSTA